MWLAVPHPGPAFRTKTAMSGTGNLRKTLQQLLASLPPSTSGHGLPLWRSTTETPAPIVGSQATRHPRRPTRPPPVGSTPSKSHRRRVHTAEPLPPCKRLHLRPSPPRPRQSHGCTALTASAPNQHLQGHHTWHHPTQTPVDHPYKRTPNRTQPSSFRFVVVESNTARTQNTTCRTPYVHYLLNNPGPVQSYATHQQLNQATYGPHCTSR